MITSLHNSHIQLLKHLLQNSKYRYKYKQIVLEGIHLLQEAFKRQIIEKIYLTIKSANNIQIQNILCIIGVVKVCFISEQVAISISTLKSQNDLIFTLVTISFNYTLPTNADCIALDRIQDPGNLGTILRSSLAAGVKNIILNKECTDVYNPKVLRSAMGAHFYLNIFIDINLLDFLKIYMGNIHLAVVDKQKSFSLYSCKLLETNLWVFGNEGMGIDNRLIQAKYNKVYIPIVDNVDSLNVAMAVTICLFEQCRQRLQYQ